MYNTAIEEKSAAIERLMEDVKDAAASDGTGRLWVSLFKQYENIEEVTRRALMALVDRVFIYEGHSVEVAFKYGDEFQRMERIVMGNGGMLPQER